MTSTVHWDLDIYALSSISHKDDSTSTTTALFRREEVIQPDGTGELVPIISGNSFRGTLRRIGEELLRDVLDYEGTLSLPAAHTLRSGGALRKTKGEPLSGNRLEHARNLIPLIGVFGGNSSSTMIKGRAQIGKVVPRVKETEHIMSRPSKLPLLSQFELLGIERYSRFDDSDTADFPSTAAAESDAESPATGSHLMRYEVETLPAGTTFDPGSASPEPPICRSPSSQTSSPNSQQQDDSVGDCRSATGWFASNPHDRRRPAPQHLRWTGANICAVSETTRWKFWRTGDEAATGESETRPRNRARRTVGSEPRRTARRRNMGRPEGGQARSRRSRNCAGSRRRP